MRQSLARTIALATGLIVVGAVIVFAALQQEPRLPPRPEAERPPVDEGVVTPDDDEEVSPEDARLALGRATYDAQRCAACHSIAGVGSPRYPLDGVGSRLNEDEIRLWIVDPQAIRPGVRKPSYDDLASENLEALIAFVASLETPEG